MSTNGGEISVKFSSQEESRLWQNIVRLVTATREVGAGLEKATESAAKFEKGLDKFADQVKKVDAGPVGKLREEFRKLDAAVAAELLTEEQAASGRIAAQRRYQAELRKTREERQRMGVVDPIDVSGDPSKTTAEKIEAGPLREYQAAMQELIATREKLGMDEATFAAASKAHHDEYIRQSKEIEAADRRVAEQRKLAADAKSERERQVAQEKADRQALIDKEKVEKQSERNKAALDAERDSFARQAEQIRRIDATPIERLKMRLDELRDAQKRVGMSQQDFETLSKKAHDQYQLEVRQSVAETERLKREAFETAQRSGSSFGEMGMGAMAAWTAVGATVISVLNQVRQASEEAGQALKSAAPSRGTLAQLALDDPEKYKELTAQAESLRARGVVRSLEEANQFVFAMQSAGAGDEIETFARAKRVGLMQDPSSMIASAAGIRESFGQAGGSFQDLINRSLVASASSPAKAEELLRGAGKAGVAARQQGITVDELLAATSIMATAKGSADEGGSRLNALLMALAVTEPKLDARGRVAKDSPIQQTLRGRSLADIGSDEAIRAMSPVQLQKLLGSREAVEGLGIVIEQVSKLKELTPRVAQGVQENKLERGIAIVENDPQAMAAARVEAAAGALEIARLKRGQESLQVDALIMEGQRTIEETPQQSLFKRIGTVETAATLVDILQGRPLTSVNNITAMASVSSNAARSMAGGTAMSGARTALEFVGGDAVFLDVMRRIGLGGDKQAASADKLADAADKLTAAADRLGTMTPGPRAVNRTGPARLEAAGAN